MHALALPRTVADIIGEYEAKSANVEQAIASFEQAFLDLGSAMTVQGCFVEPVGSKSYLYADSLRKNLLKSGWQAVYNRLDIQAVASAKDRQLFERTLADPPPLTMDNAKATFGDYLIRPRFHILRGLAEVFSTLDPAYKSHSKVRIGVKGLPKRIILDGWGEYSTTYSRNRFKDIINALAAYQGKRSFEWHELQAIDAAHSRGEDAVLDGRSYATSHTRPDIYATIDRGMRVRKFANGNAHLFFDPPTLLDINRALAEFYGEVLPDAEDDVEQRASTSVSKDLQFYWSPPAVVDAALDFAGISGSNAYSHGRTPPVYRVLEPSCGDGRILDEIRARGSRALGIEVDPGRAAQARANGHAVVTGNFLEQAPQPVFEKVVMNPPFYGRHYLKHLRHALEWLAPGGTLVSILPATAHYDHGELTGDLKGEWRDLPVASFTAAGTNAPTGMLRIDARRTA